MTSGCTTAPSCCCVSHLIVRPYGWRLLEPIGGPCCCKTVLAAVVGAIKEFLAKGSKGGMAVTGAVSASTVLGCWAAHSASESGGCRGVMEA
ncbi:unnamed protein product [Prunus armeniaca]|uniref:Uncharacterized protein n=1 Tax=Prunus armeniaca TaxID=36596 RepID=A0A6J5UA94_PRUAR|nr:unnamed protein product [Prunus armeniaca]